MKVSIRISSVNVTTSTEQKMKFRIYYRKPLSKASFSVQWVFGSICPKIYEIRSFPQRLLKRVSGTPTDILDGEFYNND